MKPGTFPTTIPTLTTERLLLRPFALTDAAAVQRLAGDPAVADTTLNIPHPYADGMAEAWISRHAAAAAAGENYVWAITDKASGTLMGCINIGVSRAHNRAELAYWIGRPFWSRGYVTEAGHAVVRFGFEALALNNICAAFFTRNPASGKVMAKLGMKPEGTRRQWVRKGDAYEDVGYCSILRADWEANLKPITMQPIGLVRNGRNEPVDEGWGDVVSEIVLRPDLHGICAGLESFSHALVICHLHETPAVDEVQRRPRGRADMPMLGLLAQRARHRPNPLAVTAVRVVGVAPDRLTVQGLDAIDGTPVLDIKPYFPVFDRRDDATVPEWVDRLMEGYFR